MAKILQVKQLDMTFKRKPRPIHAVNKVSFSIEAGETFSIVGESGSGKTTLGKVLFGLYPQAKGQVIYRGEDLLEAYQNGRASRDIQMVFQDPYTSLNPMLTIEEIITEALLHKEKWSEKNARSRAETLLDRVGIPGSYLKRYPHELSGGQRQRVGIARALSTSPELIILDEPISSLDVSTQATIVKLLKSLQREQGLTYLFISHDLEMVRYISDQVAVMYLGRFVEYGPSEAIYQDPQHVYTQHLLHSILKPDPTAPSLKSFTPLAEDHPDILRLVHQESHWEEVSPGHFVQI